MNMENKIKGIEACGGANYWGCNIFQSLCCFCFLICGKINWHKHKIANICFMQKVDLYFCAIYSSSSLEALLLLLGPL